MPKLSWIGPFSTLDRPDMGLLQTDNTVVAAVGAVVVHFLLLPVHNRDHSQTVPQPAGKQGVCVRNQGRILFQLPGSQQDIIQLLSNGLPALRLGPLLAFRQFQIGFPGLFG